MKITKHVSFYFLIDRIKFLNKILEETNQYEITTDIFIHTNSKEVEYSLFNEYTNGEMTIVYHDLTNIHPYFLTWKCRDLLKQQQNDYDIFMYIEDDILVPYKAIQYWLAYHEKLIHLNYNLGFVRIEIENNIEYITDLFGEKLDTIIRIHENDFCVNNKNPYCAFWIYNKNEFNKFVHSEYYNPYHIVGYEIREISAVGLHGVNTPWYKNTVIPIINNHLNKDCKIYHLSNNYVVDKSTTLATIKFDEAIKFNT
jgi:hypothetical protein